jgi:hypothetical protein
MLSLRPFKWKEAERAVGMPLFLVIGILSVIACSC